MSAHSPHAGSPPDSSAESCNRRGEVLLRDGASDDAALAALAEFDRALRLDPGFAIAAANRGRALRRLNRLHEAIDWHSRALALDPALAPALVGRAEAQHEVGNDDAAVHDYAAALALGFDRFAVRKAYALLLADAGRAGEACELLRGRALEGEERAEADFLIAAMTGITPPPAPPPHYVARLFDSYARRFEKHLVRGLKYRAPQLLAEALLPLLPPGPQRIVDLGCGTGLMAPLLRPRAARLDGVDISAGMIERAAVRQTYDELHVADLVGFLDARAAAYDVATAADVLVYIGDLEPVFGKTRRALRKRGLFAFTVEILEEGDYMLQPTRRYAHARAYIERLAAAQDFATLSISRRVLRLNDGVEVPGLVVVLAAGRRG